MGRPKISSKKEISSSKVTEKKVDKKRGRPAGSKNKPKVAVSKKRDRLSGSKNKVKVSKVAEILPKKRGRPAGSKNKPKEIVVVVAKRRGRPKGSKNKANDIQTIISPLVDEKVTKRRGRPKGSKNNPKGADISIAIGRGSKELAKKEVEEINEDILGDTPEEKTKERTKAQDMLEQVMFKIPDVHDPLIGTPKEVQTELDGMAYRIKKDPDLDHLFDKMHLYMHGYLINMVLKKFPFIVGYQSVDIYQETLIALRFKAIPNFNKSKGMSFLNFAKMCIRRHLITLLHASKNRIKDRTMNMAISLDSSPMSNENDSGDSMTYANIISDKSETQDNVIENDEAYSVTLRTLMNSLSDFERVVLEERLSSSSYKEMAKDISRRLEKRYNAKSIDNALLRIRKKAYSIIMNGKKEDIPLFLT